MKKVVKKWVSILLVIAMLISSAQLGGFVNIFQFKANASSITDYKTIEDKLDFYESHYLKQHYEFVNSDTYNDLITYERWAYILGEAAQSSIKDDIVELVYDVLDVGNSFVSLKFDDINFTVDVFNTVVTNLFTSQEVSNVFSELYDKYVDLECIKYFKKLKKIFQSDEKWEKSLDFDFEIEQLWQMKTDHSDNKFLKCIQDVLMANGQTKFEVDSLFAGIEAWSDITGSLGDISTLAETFAKCMQYKASIDAFRDTSDEFKLIFSRLGNSGNEVFDKAIETYLNCLDDDYANEYLKQKILKENAFASIEILNDVFQKVIVKGIAQVFNLGTAAAAKVSGTLFAYKFGFSLSNAITGNDVVIDCRRLLRANYLLESRLYPILTGYADSLKNNESYELAKLFDAAYNMFRNVQLFSLQTYSDMLNNQKDTTLTCILAYLKLRDKTAYEEEIKMCAEGIAKWNTECHIPNSFLISEAWAQIYNQMHTIACPTDVCVYDMSGNKLVEIIDNKIVYNNSKCIAVVADSKKVIFCPNDIQCRIIITGTATGTMNYTIDEYSSDNVVRTIKYEDVPLESGLVYRASAPNEIMQASEAYRLETYDNIIIEPTSDSLPPIQDTLTDVVVAEELFEGFSTELIDKVANTMFGLKSSVDIESYAIKTDDAVALFSAIAKYYPSEYSILVGGDFSYRIICSPERGIITKIRFYYGSDTNLSDYQRRVNELNAEINKLVAQMQGMSEFEKALYLHDYIVLNSEYDMELLDIIKKGTLTGEIRSERYTEYSILVNGTGVCGSYALAYRAVLNAAGMECLYLSSAGMNHAWNLVKIDGNWYHVDCCWDDPVPDQFGRARRTYFLRTDDEIMNLQHYSWTPGQYKATSSTFSSMPRNYDVTQKYNNGNWYYLIGGKIYKSNVYGNNKEEICSLTASTIDVDSGNIYYAKGTGIYKYNIDTDKGVIMYTMSASEAGNSFTTASIKNIYVDGNTAEIYKTIYKDSEFKAVRSNVKLTDKYAAITGIEIGESELTLDVFGTKQLTATLISTASTSGIPITWISSNEMVASVDTNGNVTANNVGSAVITASFGDYESPCNLTVNGDGLSGKCGNSMNWSFDLETKTMNLYGYGAMSGYSTSTNPPWYGIRKQIENLVVGEGVTTISAWTFDNSTSLKSISFSSTLTSLGSYAFYQCSSIENLYIPGNIKELHESCFGGLTSLYNLTIEDGVEKIHSGVFSSATSLKYVYIPKSVSSMLVPFQGCPNLELIEVSPHSQYYYNDGGVVYDKIDKKLIKCCQGASMPETYYVNAGTKEISLYAFSDCNNIINIIIPDSVTYLQNYVFKNCKNLKSVVLSSNIPAIKDDVFYNCLNLESIAIPDSVESIGNYAFRNCKSIEYINIPKNVSSIGVACFNGCDKLTSINVDMENQYYMNDENALYDIDQTNLIRVFPNCRTTEFVLPLTIQNINMGAFDDCRNLQKIYINALANITFTNSGNAMVRWGFANNTKNLDEIMVSEDNPYFSSVDGVLYNKSGNKLIKYPENKADKIFYVPNTVTSIDSYAFLSCKNLSTVYLDENLQGIGSYAFKDCHKIRTITIPRRVDLTDLSAFSDCSSLDSIIINGNLSMQNGLITGLSRGVSSINYNCKKTYMAEYARFSSTLTESTYNTTFYCKTISNMPDNCTWINTTTIDEDHIHDYLLVDYIEKTDNTDGYEKYWCYCGKSEYEVIDHNYGESVIEEATCTLDGISTKICTVCSHIETETIQAISHNYTVDTSTDGNCITTPVTTYKCTRCGDTYTEEGALEDKHEYVTSVIAPTCTEKGYTQDVCSLCGEIAIYDFKSPLGHKMKIKRTEATCKEYSKIEYTCSRCDYHEILDDIDSGLAEHKIKTVTTDATCTENGKTEELCTVCGEVFSSETITAPGHSYGDWTTETNPTCTVVGKEYRVCSVCDYKDIRAISMLNHSYSTDWTIDKEATCTAEGSKSHHCTRCDSKADVTVIEKKEHTYVNSVVAPTCTTDGYTSHTCSFCGTSYTDAVTSKTGHYDDNGDGYCDSCNTDLGNYEPDDPSSNCSHMCHKSGFVGFIWKIICFFCKLFRTNQTCSCGNPHW